MSQKAQDMLCKALELAEKSKEFYVKAGQTCEQGPGKDVFEKLQADAVGHINRIQDVHKGIAAGQNWANACTLSEEDEHDVSAVFKAIAGKYGVSKACTTELGAVNTGIDLSNEIIAFYEKWAKEAEDDIEKEFTSRMVQEERASFMLLSDLQYYYEDPEGWAMSQGRGGLDGA